MSVVLERKLHRLVISDDDFYHASAYLDEAIDGSSLAIKLGMLVASIVSYSRPFTTNNAGEKSEKSVNLKLEEILDEGELELHNSIIELRDTVVAHSDYEKRSVQWVPVKGEGNGEGAGLGYCFIPIRQALDQINMYEFRDLLGKVVRRCKEQIREIESKVRERDDRARKKCQK